MTVSQQLRYLPLDRAITLATGIPLPKESSGAVLYADISGFTAASEKLLIGQSVRQGAERLAAHLNRIYSVLIESVYRHGGVVIGFSGDAILCWFAGEPNDMARYAAHCAFDLRQSFETVSHIPLPNGEMASIGLKVSVATGLVQRFIVGDPAIRQIDVLVGTPVMHTAWAESLITRGEIIIDEATAAALGSSVRIGGWREYAETGERYALVDGLDVQISLRPIPVLNETAYKQEELRPWLLPDVFSQLEAGLGDYLTELRPATALFVHFSGINFAQDNDAESRLDRFVRAAQQIVQRQGGNVLQLTIGDKGSYLYAAFGAPIAHENDIERALNAALALQDDPTVRASVAALRIGIAQGVMRTGAYGSETCRTYGVLGDAVNLAARLMQTAKPNTILVNQSVHRVLSERFEFEALPPLQVKGKVQPQVAYQVGSRRDRAFDGAFYSVPQVGREGEVTALIDSIQPVFEGEFGAVITIHGEPGMGKSRLAYELQRQFERQGGRWFTGQTDELQSVPLQPFIYFLSRYFNQRRERSSAENQVQFDAVLNDLIAQTDDPAIREDLNLYASFIAGTLGIVIPNSLFETADTRLRIENATAGIKAWLRAESRQQPVVIHLEDIHWMDESSFNTVRNLTYNMDNYPVVLVLTSRFRDDGTTIQLDKLGDVRQYHISLKQLAESDIRFIVEHVLGSPVTQSLVDLIRDKAEGNPFFVEQLALDLRERGLLTTAGGMLDLRQNTEAEVPSGVNAVLIARLDRLTTQVKAVVQTASVLGREFDLLVLSRMLRVADNPYIDQAEREGIWSALNELRYIFRHALLRDAAYQMQVQTRLRDLHQIAAEAIEALYPNSDQVYNLLAEHWRLAEVPTKELHYTILAAEHFQNSSSYQKALALAQRALTLLPTPDIMPEAGRLLHLIGNAYSEIGELNQARNYFSHALALSRQHDNWEEICRNLALIGLSHLLQTSYDLAIVALEEALQIARQHNIRELMPQILMHLNWAEANQSRGEKAMEYVREALEIANAINDPRILRSIRLTGSGGWTFALQGKLEEARQIFQANADASLLEGYRSAYANATYSLGWVAEQYDDWETAERYYNMSLPIAYDVGSFWVLGEVLRGQGRAALHREDWAKALEWFDEGLRNTRRMGDKRGEADTTAAKWKAYVRLGQPDRALACLKEGLQLALATHDEVMVVDTLALLMMFYYETGDASMCARVYTFLRHNPNTHGRVLNVVKANESKILPTFTDIPEALVPPSRFDLDQFVADLINS